MGRPIIIDCDPGVDDCIALLLALGAPEELNILGICTVAGNVPVKTCSQNACSLLTFANRTDIPVYQGCPRPIVVAPVTADHVHGKSGLGDADLPAPQCVPKDVHAVDYLIRTLGAADKESITLVMTGPLTNLAVALVKVPEIAASIAEIVIMGGARAEGGNITASAEFNIYADPHAAHVVFESGCPITLIGLDTSLQIRCTPMRMKRLQASGHPACDLAHAMISHVNRVYADLYGAEGAALHDPCTIGYLLAPDLYKFRMAKVSVDTRPGLTRGHTAVDIYLNEGGQPNISWATWLDDEPFFEMLLDRMTRL